MPVQFKRLSNFEEGKPLDVKLLNEELDRVTRFINSSVELKELPAQDNLYTRTNRRKRSLVPRLEPPDDNPGTPTNPNDPGNPKNPVASVLSGGSLAAVASDGIYPSIPIAATLTKDHIGSDVVIGSIPSGFTVRRWYSRTEEVFANVNNEIEIKDFNSVTLVYRDQIDLKTKDAIGDSPMDHPYTAYTDIVAHIYGSASATGRVRITFQLEKVYEKEV